MYEQTIQVLSPWDARIIREYHVPENLGMPSNLSLAPDESFLVFDNPTDNEGDVEIYLMRLN